MNKILLVGRLVKDPEIKVLQEGERMVAKFTVAVNRNYKNSDGENKADFVPVSVWGKRAEIIMKYLQKGSFVSISGRLNTGSYEDKEGNRRYTYEVVAEDFHFVENRKKDEVAQ
ncbi:single-stranded DNA-binding protein [Clostridium algidicarnis]|uniref:Single-stranded DNA-binding protein n=2 Tax=Clostridium algidicarnis TaxID=37659 RepID=A0A2S6FYJ9_9CLOT|nr:single-stranded DNA-binding protein [Clostridium algidicarnis]MBB6631539.1 single-stranded DNA-binding protein [Clostridium algidicarnis]MBB6697940.1 single-stranded DNA-binding protein [Clostridium algidicarnis]MBU3193163.1 single-stranded DNA-binding protein [Clostridium algidicarnis]MBU3196219.1 single-stranded DNA-binding protein [Clostridium algidicarnis]MBU3205049.1 single-stranded DNA-binding protein [Clostridium algidicarnis]